MLPKPRTWVLAGLFLLFGVAMLMTEGEVWRRSWAGLSLLSLGGFMLSMVMDSLAAGQVWIRTSVVRRAQQPQLYWVALVLYVAAGAAVLIAGLWFLFLRS